nr:unnamed protein product [Callosobruchus chinensis]
MSSELFFDSYDVHRKDRAHDRLGLSTGGGVLLAMDPSLKSEVVSTTEFEDTFPEIDFILCKCNVSFHVLYIAVIYIPPHISTDNFDSFFDMLGNLEYLYSKNLIIMGDFNCAAYIENKLEDRRTSIITNWICLSGLNQHSSIRNSYGKLLDLVISKVDLNVIRELVPFVNEDVHHPALSVLLNTFHIKDSQFSTNTQHVRYNFRKANFPALYNELISIEWNYLHADLEPNLALQTFYNQLYAVIDKHVPTAKIFRHKYPVWYTSDMIKIVKDKAKYYKKFKIYQNITYHQEFCRLRATFKQKREHAYKEYLQTMQSRLYSEPKSFWSFIHNKNNTSRIPSKMNYQNASYTDPTVIVNAFAEFFQSVYSAPDETTIHDINTVFRGNNFIDISCEPISEEEIISASKKIKNKLTSGPDQLPSFFIKDCIGLFLSPLKAIFNSILNSTIFPNKWKVAKVCPIYKSLDKSSINNYRPIAILNNFAKLFEIIVYNRIYLATKNILSIDQHGFMKQRSTITNLATVSQYLCDHMDNRGQVDVIYTDFTKAFDKIDHNILIQKIECLGFNKTYVDLLKSYISLRPHYVYYNGFSSSTYIANSGVPQGSNLGPLLFIIYVNDLCESLACNKLMFADDLKLFASISDWNDCVILQEQIAYLENWCAKNRLVLNISKCRILTFSRKISTIMYPYKISNVLLERSDNIKDLGVYFDSHLTFNHHIREIVKSAYCTYGFIVRNCRQFGTSTLLMLFLTLVVSKLEYGALIWSPIYDLYKNSIERVQRRFLKYLCFKNDSVYPPRGCDYSMLLSRFEVTSLTTRRELISVVFLYKMLHGSIDCSTLLSQLNFLVPRFASRLSKTFFSKKAQTNLLSKAPLNFMCYNANKIDSVCDIFCCGLNELKDAIQFISEY